MSATLVYTSQTDVRPASAPAFEAAYEPYCFVCRRCTDHVGEHEALEIAGLATYGEDGTVERTEAWDDDLAAAIAEAEWAEYQATFGMPV